MKLSFFFSLYNYPCLCQRNQKSEGTIISKDGSQIINYLAYGKGKIKDVQHKRWQV